DVGIDRQARVVDEVADEAIALRPDDAADAGGIVGEAVGQADADDLGAQAGELLHRRVVGREHLGVDAEPLVLRHDGEPQPLHAPTQRRHRIGRRPRERRRVLGVGCVERAEEQGGVLHRARHRSQTVGPPVVPRPLRSTRSFSAIGMPCRAPIRWPLVIARSAASAASRASYSYIAMYACSASRALMRASSAPTTSTGDSARLSNAADSSARPAQTGSTTLMTSVLLPGLLRPRPARAPTRGTTPGAGACGRR